MTIMESLKERHEKYRLEETKAKDAGNASKARRMGRIKAQYEEAMRLHKAGRPIPRSDLPDPPGFAPIPVSDPAPPRDTRTSPAPAPAPTPGPASAPARPQEGQGGASGGRKGAAPPAPARQSSVMSVQDKQLAGLTKRQAMFKAAALQAKQQGQTDTAKEYLRQALSFNKLIEVSKAGLPVDMGTLPVPPQMQARQELVLFPSFLPVNIIPCVQAKSEIDHFNQSQPNYQQQNTKLSLLDLFNLCCCFKFSCKKSNKVHF